MYISFFEVMLCSKLLRDAIADLARPPYRVGTLAAILRATGIFRRLRN